MKKILFVLDSIKSGGSATSMLNLLGLLKEKGYTTDIFLMLREGCFLGRAESVATVLPEEKIISSIRCSKSELKRRGFGAMLIRMVFGILCRLLGREKTTRLFYKASAKKLAGKYDTVVAYQETISTEYAQHIKCNKRIAWIHSNYCRFVANKTKEYEQELYNHFDEIVCVSQSSKNSMLENLDLSEDHVHLIYNTIPHDYIIQQSKEPVESLDKRTYTFVSMGRFNRVKRFDRAVEVAARFKRDGLDFIWYIIGDGEDYTYIQKQIIEKELEDYLVLLGLKTNPFPYIKQADCFVLTSESETQPMVLNEALTLDVPVIATRFSSVAEVVADGVNGFIVDNSADGVYNGIIRYIEDEEARHKITAGAKDFLYQNEEILNQIINLL